MPHVNLRAVADYEDEPHQVYRRPGKQKAIPRHIIRSMARDDVMQNKPCFSCPSCRVNYGLRYGREAKKGAFGERTLYCLDCIDNNTDIHKL